MTTKAEKIKYWKKEVKLNFDAYISVSKEARGLERENKKLKKQLENYYKIIENIAKLVWKIE